MIRYFGRRLLQAVIVLWAAFTLAFVILYALPGDPAVTMLSASVGDVSMLTPSEIAQVRADFGFDRPLALQYLSALGGILTGHWGTSYSLHRPVLQILVHAIPSTVQLTVPAFALALLVGGALAISAVYTRSALLRGLLLSLPPAAVSIPTFWIGLTLLQWFSFGIHLFPATGDRKWSAVVLPAVTVAIPTAAVIAQVLAKNLMSQMREQFVNTARAKGAGRLRLLVRHVLRNASLPALTVVGVSAGNLLAGAIITENVFSRNGLGYVTVQAVTNRDIPLVLGVVVLVAGVFVVINLVVDALYAVLDPRLGARMRARAVARTGEPVAEAVAA